MSNTTAEKPWILMTAKHITPTSQPDIVHSLEERYTLIFLNTSSPTSTLSTDVASRVQGVVGQIYPNLMDALPNVGIIACIGVGLDKLDLAACRRRGIKVTNVPELSSADVADFAILLMLCSFRRLLAADRYIRQGLWPLQGSFMLTRKASGKRVGIVGLGHIGMAIARRAEAFGCSISYCGRSWKPEVSYVYHADIVDLAKCSDVMFVACVLTEETRHLVDRKVLDALGPEGVLVNIARGAVVNERDLIEALKEGSLGSAALDVFETEPNVPQELLSSGDNVVLAPHIASATKEIRHNMAQIVIANLNAFFSGKPLVTPVLA
eukprot:c24117_g20_i1 orf=360-1328(-)